MVFSTLIVVAFAASENLSSKYLTGTITADKSFWGDSASAGGEYIENSHTHGSTELPLCVGSYMGVGMDAYFDDWEMQDIHVRGNNHSAPSVSEDYPFGKDLNRVVAEIGIECGDCNNMYNLFDIVYAD